VAAQVLDLLSGGVVTAYHIELFLHVIAVIIVFGITFAYPFLQGAAERAGTGQTKFALGLIHRLETYVVTPGAVVVLILGGILIGNDKLPYKDDMPAWLMIAVVWFLAAFAVGFFVQRRNVKQALAVLEPVSDSAPLPAAYEPIGKRMQMVGGLLGFSVIAIAFLMVYKPGQ
jgi:uncharacterized membrane protein